MEDLNFQVKVINQKVIFLNPSKIDLKRPPGLFQNLRVGRDLAHKENTGETLYNFL